MGNHAVRVGPAHLGPQRRFHVLPEGRSRVPREPVDAAGYSFDITALMKLREAAARRDGQTAQGIRSSSSDHTPLVPGLNNDSLL